MSRGLGDVYKRQYVATPLGECERRDVKGLYAKARRGEIRDFTGISAPFEEPERPELRIDTSGRSVEACTEQLLQHLVPQIIHNRKLSSEADRIGNIRTEK